MIKRTLKEKLVPYVCLSPFFVLFLTFGLFPIVFSFIISLNKWKGTDAMEFVGLNNYTFMLTEDIYFWKSLGTTLWFLVFAVLTQHLFALPLAITLNSRLVRGKHIFKVIYFIPYITGAVSISLLFTYFFNYNYGFISSLNSALGLPPMDWFENPSLVPIKIAFVVNWRNIGWNTLLYLAGLQAISPELYDAVELEGASPYQKHSQITIPVLMPIIFFAVTFSIINGLQLFDEPFILTKGFGRMGGPNNAGLTLSFYVMWLLQRKSNLGGGCAVSWLLSVAIMVLTFINFRINRAISRK
jgi:ABC-type sugar transport system permease subunit